MPKGVPNKRYTPEFKKLVIETMQEEKLSYSETCRRFEVNSRDRIKSWERIYLEEGPEGLAIERRGRGFGRRATPAQKTLVVQKLRQKHALSILLSIAQLPRATFYYYLKQMQKEDKYASVKEEITTIYHENRGRYGYRRITAELRKRNFLLKRSICSFQLSPFMHLVCCYSKRPVFQD